MYLTGGMLNPCSTHMLDDKIETFLRNFPYESYLDIGAGDGKFGRMIRRLNPKAHITAVEPDESLVMDESYNTIFYIEANDLIYRFPDFRTDITIMGDVLEHMKKSEAIDFLNFILYRTKYLILKFPICYVQLAQTKKEEAHVSIWFFEDLENLHLPLVVKESEGATCLAVIKGLLAFVEESKDRDLNIEKIKKL